jgi:rRNA processing protein Krr1/Pno1
LARTIQFPKQDADGNTIKVEGRKDVVEKIVARIQTLVSERENQVTQIVDVPTEKHSKLIGRGGAIRKEMEGEFKVTIEVPKQADNKTGVKITGRPEAVEKAKAHILNLVKDQQGEAVQVPRSLHHAVSNNGQFFRNAKRDHQVTIDHAGQPVPPKPSSTARANGGSLPLITDDDDQTAEAHSWSVVDNSSTEEGDIPWVLRGSAESIEKIKQAIQVALAQAQKGSTTGYLGLPDPRTFRHVIGPNGSKVKSIRNQSGCRINVPTRGQDDDAIEIIGSKEGVEKAKDLILAAVRDGSSSREGFNGRSRE